LRGFFFSSTVPCLPRQPGGDGVGGGLIPDAFGAIVVVLFLLKGFVEPARLIVSGAHTEIGLHLPVIPGHEGENLVLALHENGERRGFHASDRRLGETAVTRVEGGHRPGAVDPDQPIALGTAHRGIREGEHLLVGAQMFEGIDDGLIGHRLHPHPLHRLFDLGEMDQIAEDEFSLATGVTSVDDHADIFAPHELCQHLEPGLAVLDRLQFEGLRHDRKMLEAAI